MNSVSIDEITGALYEITGLDAVDLDTPIGELGLDSLALVEWLYAIEDRLEIEIDEATVERLPEMSVTTIWKTLASPAA
jgi:acyl carrier protein